MTYTREMFASELEGLLSTSTIEHAKIAAWAFETRLRHLPAIDVPISEWLLQLGAMDMGPEFEFSKEELQSMIGVARKT